jgi:hypothetical protein
MEKKKIYNCSKRALTNNKNHKASPLRIIKTSLNNIKQPKAYQLAPETQENASAPASLC